MTLEFAEPSIKRSIGAKTDAALNVHYLTVLRLCMRQLGDVSDAEDATQETFRRAIQHGDAFVGDPLPWLIAVARNICIDELRRRRSGRTALERTAARSAAEETNVAADANPERVVVSRMFVGDFMGKLTPAERRVVTTRLVDGTTGSDLAASVGITASTTRVLLARAREKLRRFMLEEGAALGALAGGWHSLRRRLATAQAWLAEPRAELLLPPLVAGAVITAMGGGPAAAVVATTGAPNAAAPFAIRLDSAPEAGSGAAGSREMRTLAQAAGGAAPAARTPAPPASHAATYGGPGGLVPQPDANAVWVDDFEPSPDYSSDHTVYLIGGGNCWTPCSQLYRSRDGGATWTYLPTTDLQSTQLVLPPSSYGAGRFFAAGGNVLQVTDNFGDSFHAYGPLTGFTTAAPGWMAAQAVTADEGLSLVDGAQTPHLVALFGAGDLAVAPTLLLPGAAGGFTALQVVQDQVSAAPAPDTLLRCTSAGCATQSRLPLTSSNVQLLASPSFATDHTLFAIGGGVAVSHDGGNTFQLVSTEPVYGAIAYAGPAGVRLLAVDPARISLPEAPLVYSDDMGQTWHDAGGDASIPGIVHGHSPRLLAPGRLIASAADPRHPGMHLFVCSSDGVTWSACGSA